MVTFPVSQLRTKYTRTTGENNFKKLLLVFDVKTEEFDDGYQAKLKDLFNQLFAYRNWQEAPARSSSPRSSSGTRASPRCSSSERPPTCVDGQNFFSTTHPCNIGDSTVGTAWSNYQSSTKDVISISNIQAEVTAMMSVKDENGHPRSASCPTRSSVPIPKSKR
jgi:hypothetical protein